MGTVRWIVPAILSWAVASALATPAPYQLTELGFTGPGYTNAGPEGFYQYSYLTQLNAAGDVAGSSSRFDPTGANVGGDAWVYTPSGGMQQVGLIGDGNNFTATTPSYPFNGIGLNRASFVVSMNATGQAAGGSGRYTPSGDSLGWDAWFWDGATTTRIGLTTGLDTGTRAGGLVVSNTVKAMNDAGQVIGYSQQPTVGGNDVWIYSGGVTTQIGFIGTNYQTSTGYRQSAVFGINNAGQVSGESYVFAGDSGMVGRQQWIYKNGQTLAIGLTGPDYTYTINGVTTQYSYSYASVNMNEAGEVIGTTDRYTADQKTSLGGDAWIYNGTSTQAIGLMDADHSYSVDGRTIRGGIATALNASGQVIGTSARYNILGVQLGQDAWFFNGATTQQIGLAGGVYSSPNTAFSGGGVLQNSTPVAINNAGKVIGYNSLSYGYDPWFFDGATTRNIGLNGPGYSFPVNAGTEVDNTPLQINASGQTIGTSSRYDASGNALGQDGWFYDPLTKTTTPLRFSTNAATGYSATTPALITDTGFVLGDYELFNGSTDAGLEAFIWSAATGMTPLGMLVENSLSADQWATLATMNGFFTPQAAGVREDGSPQFIVGTGYLVGQDTSAGSEFYPASQSIYLLAPVPEPASLSLCGAVAVTLVGRRRK